MAPKLRTIAVIGMTCMAIVADLHAEEFAGRPYDGDDVFADTWVATDAISRAAPMADECGDVRPDKWVGIFYWTWHTGTTGLTKLEGRGPIDNSKLLMNARDGKVQWPSWGRTHYWGEPELGYYRATDPFVIRKHASMLSDAGVDVVFFDVTNPPFTFREQYEALCREFMAMRAEGARTPSIGFLTPFGDPRPVVAQLWSDLYEPGEWRDLWFEWDGKPLLLANREYFKNAPFHDFFTFRTPMPDYWNGPSGPDQWSWLEVHPQHAFKNSAGEIEQMSVGVAQNALPETPGPAPMSHRDGAMGRSWRDGKMSRLENAVAQGLNFDEQWERAMEVDPKFVFVTGWNEWIAGRYTEWSKYTDAECYIPGGLFVDQYTQEYSRDCEPMRGGHGDNYYYQLASWIRRFKGVRPGPTASGPSLIEIDGEFNDWIDVSPEFRDTIGDTTHRDHAGFDNLHYRNATGRNDFVVAKSAYDDVNVYFFVQTRERISPRAGAYWMLLFIDTDQNAATGWNGFDLLINQESAGHSAATVRSWNDGAWRDVGRAAYKLNGNGGEFAIPHELFGGDNSPPEFDFHWADNIQSLDDISEFGVNGDSAPNRRWNYRFSVRAQ